MKLTLPPDIAKHVEARWLYSDVWHFTGRHDWILRAVQACGGSMEPEDKRRMEDIVKEGRVCVTTASVRWRP